MFSQNVTSASAVIRKENISQHLALIQYLTAIPANWSVVYSLEWRSIIFLLTGFICLQGGKVEQLIVLSCSAFNNLFIVIYFILVSWETYRVNFFFSEGTREVTFKAKTETGSPTVTWTRNMKRNNNTNFITSSGKRKESIQKRQLLPFKVSSLQESVRFL